MDLLQDLLDEGYDLPLAVFGISRFVTENPRPYDLIKYVSGLTEEFDVFNEDDLLDLECLKVVVIARYDLGMSAGKLAAQVGHAIHIMCRSAEDDTLISEWEELESGAKIVVLGVHDQASMDEVCYRARSLEIGTYPIEDAGRTEVPPGSMTVAAIGPCYEAILDVVTGHLRPYKEPPRAPRKLPIPLVD
jgi:PTH2 family peptidyl-tRNA hydrolase